MKKGMILTFLTQIPTLLLYFATSMLMTRMLGEEGRGTYAVVYNLAVLAAVLLTLNLNQGIVFHASRTPERTAEIAGVGTTLFLFLLVAAPLLLLPVFLVPELRDVLLPRDGARWSHAAYIVVVVLNNQIGGTCSAVFMSRRWFSAVNRMAILAAACSAAGVFALYLLGNDGAGTLSVDLLLWVSCGALIIPSLFWLVLYRMEEGALPRPVFKRSLIAPVLGFSFTGYVAYLLMLVNMRFDIWVIEHHRTTADVGLYAVAAGLGQLFFHLPDPLARVIQPFLYAKDDPGMVQRFKAVARLNFTAVLLCCALLASTAWFLVPLLFGKAFAASVPALLLLLPGIVCICASKLLTPFLIDRGGVKLHLWSTSIGAVVTIALDLLLIPLWGIIGASIASSLAYLSMLIAICLLIRYRCGIPVNDIFLLHRSDLRSFLSLVRASAVIEPAPPKDPVA